MIEMIDPASECRRKATRVMWTLLLFISFGACTLATVHAQIPSELAMEKRIERGKAFIPAKRYPVSDEWVESGCHPQFPDRKTGPGRLDREMCIDERAARMPAFDPQRAHHFGEAYSPREYRDCENKYKGHDARCGVFELRRIENPYHWPHEHNKDFKWPEAPRVNVYRRGMTPDEYHKALCDAEAGEFIFQTNVPATSIYIVRPYWTSISQTYSGDRYVEEAPFMIRAYPSFYPQILVRDAGPNGSLRGFDFVESHYPPALATGRHWDAFPFNLTPWRTRKQDFGADHRNGTVLTRTVWAPTAETESKGLRSRADTLESRYGIVWRGIERPYDRELGVAGTEIAVVDLRTNEILGLLRIFNRLGRSWEGSGTCSLPSCPSCGPRHMIHRILAVKPETQGVTTGDRPPLFSTDPTSREYSHSI